MYWPRDITLSPHIKSSGIQHTHLVLEALAHNLAKFENFRTINCIIPSVVSSRAVLLAISQVLVIAEKQFIGFRIFSGRTFTAHLEKLAEKLKFHRKIHSPARLSELIRTSVRKKVKLLCREIYEHDVRELTEEQI